MPTIAAVKTAVPGNKLSQALAARLVEHHFEGKIDGLKRLMGIFANSHIDTRYLAASPQWLVEGRSFAEKNAKYVEVACQLSADAARAVMQACDVDAKDIDCIIYVNTTGLATPSMDARLANLLGLRANIRRTPLWGLGCAGGVAGLSHAHHYLLAHPDHRVLLVSTELCSLTFLPADLTKSNLVATALFGDGAAAALLCGDKLGGKGLRTIDTQSHLYPDSLDVMGWTVLEAGLQVVFAGRIPQIVEAHAQKDLSAFLARHDHELSDVSEFLFHPGGVRVVEAYEKALGLNPEALRWSRAVLRDFGNMSSTTVLFVIEKYLAERKQAAGNSVGLISALGPGFSSESILVQL